MRKSAGNPSKELSGRLRSRHGEVEEAMLNRVRSIADPTLVEDPSYTEGLRSAVAAGLDFALTKLERGSDAPDLAVPVALLAQARMAARNDIGLDTVLRRYLAGHTLIEDFLIEEAENAGISFDSAALKSLLRIQATTLDNLLSAVTEEYNREATPVSGSEERRAERIQRLLAGEFVDVAELSYPFEGWHLGLIASGEDLEEAIEDIAGELDARLLILRRPERLLWAWIGARRRRDSRELFGLVVSRLPTGSFVAIGEPSEGLAGWRLTHRQAQAAYPITRRDRDRPILRYVDVSLLAAVLQDDLAVTSLRQLYLSVLEGDRDRGEVLRETLRAYFAADQQVSSTAAALGVTRQTVTNRLNDVAARVGRPLASCATEMEVTLHLYDLDGPFSP
ncbi:MAG TPA: helix-turn-helix domain-containing protein [Solirubrobacterales bacterium]